VKYKILKGIFCQKFPGFWVEKNCQILKQNKKIFWEIFNFSGGHICTWVLEKWHF
jgi:hypothetical protein